MVKFIIRLFVILLAVVSVQPSNAAPKKNKKEKKEQVNDLAQDEIQMVVFGEGLTKEEAVKNALRSAIEQNYGIFVSSSSSIMNDELIKDEIATVSSGNVRKFNILHENEKDGKYYVTLDAIISIGKLISFVKSNGGATELDGNTFAMNYKLHAVKEANSRQAIAHLKEEVAEMMNNCYDYKIEVNEPSGRYGVAFVEVKVTASLNKNFYNAMSYARKTLESLSVPIDEVRAESKLGSICYSYWGDKYGSLSLEFNNGIYDYGYFYGSGNDRRPVTKDDFNDIYFTWGATATPEGIIPSDRIAQIFNFVISDGLKEYYPYVCEEYHNGRDIDWYWTIIPSDMEISKSDFDTNRLSEVRTQYVENLHTSGRKILHFETKEFTFVLKYNMDEIASVREITVEPLNGRQRQPIFWEKKGTGYNTHLVPLEK